MKTSELLHFAFRSRDPLSLGRWYADLFEGQFFPHPVMSALGIVIVKLNHSEAVFNGLIEFWPWDLVWDGDAAVFRKVEPRPSPTSYGHAAMKIGLSVQFADIFTFVAICEVRLARQRGVHFLRLLRRCGPKDPYNCQQGQRR